ncbi:MAG: SDR family NAD(P)-dependent oxidoreductase [Chloroflexota bacterium]|jgi:short-subunit dehydrogenase
MEDLRGKNAIVTGASRGVGVHIAHALASEGVHLVLAARSAERLADVAESVRRLGVRAVDVPADITRATDRAAIVAAADQRLGQIDILVNNAAIIEWSRFEQEDPEDIGLIIETNLVAPLLLARMVLPAMVQRRSGHIVNHGSLAGKIAIPFEATYDAAKGGLHQWSMALRQELESTGVGVTSILPSYITEVGQAADHGVMPPRLSGPVSPERVASAVIEAVRRNPPEIIVRSTPTRPLLAVGELMPGFAARLMRSMGMARLHRGLADRRERSF